MPEVRGRSVVCFSNIEWGIWKQRHHHLMERFARENRVLFVETVGMRSPKLLSARDLRRIGGRLGRAARRVVSARRSGRDTASPPPGLHIHSPLVVPFHESGTVRRVNTGILLRDLRRLLQEHGMSDPILWVYLPVRLILQVADRLPHRLLVYDCVDEITQFHEAPPSLARSEETLIRRADLIFATARPLESKCRRLSSNVHYVPNAGDVEMFSRKPAEPVDLAAIPRPRVGYVGAIREWFDRDLLAAAAARFPRASFVLVGDDTPDLNALRALANVHVLGPRPYADLPAYLNGFDVSLIPFRDTELIRSTHPVKVYEYLAAGSPVISTPMDEIGHLAEVDMAAPLEPFLDALGRRLAEGRDPEGDERRRRSVAGETWDARFEAIDRIVSASLRETRRAAEG